jgi:hypothetical protein
MLGGSPSPVLSDTYALTIAVVYEMKMRAISLLPDGLCGKALRDKLVTHGSLISCF